MTEQETIHTIALTQLKKLSLINAHVLYENMGNATSVFENRSHLKDFIPDATDMLTEALKDVDEALKRAETEWEYACKKSIQCICYNDMNYPALLRQCPDAPLVLYYFGNADINRKKIINIVGTRKCTDYGKDIIGNFVSDLSKNYPDTLIVSGLAYGVDIHAHTAALKCGMDTVGVLAHGLDTIYPARHRQTAAKMTRQGGLLTEYMSGTTAQKGNFVRRNRIVAGMAEATVVVESAAKGGALITAELAGEYDREVFAFPGRIYDQYSEGCNKLISRQEAHLIQSASDFMRIMGWEEKTAKKEEPMQDLFPQLSAEEQAVVNALKGEDSKQINKIAIDTNLSYSKVSSILFELEMKGIVTVLGGARYRLLRH